MDSIYLTKGFHELVLPLRQEAKKRASVLLLQDAHRIDSAIKEAKGQSNEAKERLKDMVFRDASKVDVAIVIVIVVVVAGLYPTSEIG